MTKEDWVISARNLPPIGWLQLVAGNHEDSAKGQKLLPIFLAPSLFLMTDGSWFVPLASCFLVFVLWALYP